LPAGNRRYFSEIAVALRLSVSLVCPRPWIHADMSAECTRTNEKVHMRQPYLRIIVFVSLYPSLIKPIEADSVLRVFKSAKYTADIKLHTVITVLTLLPECRSTR
jgi:hypothetical protein